MELAFVNPFTVNDLLFTYTANNVLEFILLHYLTKKMFLSVPGCKVRFPDP